MEEFLISSYIANSKCGLVAGSLGDVCELAVNQLAKRLGQQRGYERSLAATYVGDRKSQEVLEDALEYPISATCNA
jgi:hypothetical protein